MLARGLDPFVQSSGGYAAARYALYGAAFALALVTLMGLLGGDALHGALFASGSGGSR